MTGKGHPLKTQALPGPLKPYCTASYTAPGIRSDIVIYAFRPRDLFSGHPNTTDVCTRLRETGYKALTADMRRWLTQNPLVITKIKEPCLVIPEQLTGTPAPRRGLSDHDIFVIWEMARTSAKGPVLWAPAKPVTRNDYCRFIASELVVVCRAAS